MKHVEKPRVISVKHVEKPRVISVSRAESVEGEAPPTLPLFHRPTAMAEPNTEAPLVILLRPSWLDIPITRLTWALARVAIAAVPAMLLAEAVWRFIHF